MFMSNTDCFFCLESILDDYLNLHPKSKFAHLCHTRCLQEYQTRALKSLALCPLCREPATYLEDELSDNYPQPKSYKNWMALIRYFRTKNIVGEEILNFFFGDDSIYYLPIKGSKADLALQKLVLNAMDDDFSHILSIFSLSTWNALARFIARYDMVYLGKIAMLRSRNKRRTMSYFMSSTLLFGNIKFRLRSNPHPDLFFYSKNSKPSPVVIDMIYRGNKKYANCKWQLQLLEESLQYHCEDDWCRWVIIVEAIINIPFAKFRNCALLACIYDFVEVIRWLMTNFTLTEETIFKYYILAKSLGSVKIEAFLQPVLQTDSTYIDDKIIALIIQLQNFKENYNGYQHGSASEWIDKIPGIETLTPTQDWLTHLCYLFWNPPCYCYGGIGSHHSYL